MYILLTILVIILIPFPVTSYFFYNNHVIVLKLYNKKVKEIQLFKKTKKVKNNLEIKHFYYPFDYIKEIKKFHFKPYLKVKANITLGFDDAAKTAEIFGFTNYFIQLTFLFSKNFFKIKNIDYKINPDFKKSILEIKIHSIIWINIAKTIYIIVSILYIMVKTHNKYKKVNYKELKYANN